MTLEQLIQAVHAKYSGDTDYPTDGDDEWDLYKDLLNNGVNRWETEGVDWDELYVTGTTTVSTGDTQITAPTGFVRLGSKVKVYSGDQYVEYKIIHPGDVRRQGSGSRYAFVTGNPKDGFKINLNPAVESEHDGWSVSYIYYKQATKLSATSDISECPDPYFLVDMAVSELKKIDEDAYGHSTALRDAENKLKVMRSNLMKLPQGEASQIEQLDDFGFGV